MSNFIKIQQGEMRRTKGLFRIEAGEAWVTLKGCSEDFILKAGDLLPEGEDRLIEALSRELVLREETVLPVRLPGEEQSHHQPNQRDVQRLIIVGTEIHQAGGIGEGDPGQGLSDATDCFQHAPKLFSQGHEVKPGCGSDF
jgi:hypothetical protein